ncbi:hypothetical protein [Kitasatospora purpeofusca]|uniref:hypothetical protein n=1 Tax=Kitasatospora purpeofusca TaxID=67352 RepID=UPI002A5AD16A|nr:hypothetical protein [Kitasatospora purpeofusca]MDY0816308.1 hypothetical protein [Kitasatospora purpeofusca]
MSEAGHRLPPLRAGRKPAGLALLRLLDDPAAPPLAVVSGPPGIGKSHLVRWLTSVCTRPDGPPGRRPDVALSLAGTTADTLVWRIATRLGVSARTAPELAEALSTAGRPVLLFLRDLDRSIDPDAVAAGVLARLLTVSDLRMVVEGDESTGSLFRGAAVLDLADSGWTDRDAFSAWYAQRRGASPFDTEDVWPSPGSALLAATVTAAGPDGRRAGVPAAWWAGVEENVRRAVGVLAGAVQPLTLAQWSAAAGAEAAVAAARVLPQDPAEDGTWWLPAGPLRDTVVAASTSVDRARLARALAGTVPRRPDRSPDWTRATSAELGLVLRQAVAAGLAEEVLEDFELLAHADPVAVTAVLADHPDTEVSAAWTLAGPDLVDEPDPAVRSRLFLANLRRPARAEASGSAAPESAHWTAVETVIGRLAEGQGSPLELLESLVKAELVICVDARTGEPLVTSDANGRPGVEACTRRRHVPCHWAVVEMPGRRLAEEFEQLDLRINPVGPISVTLPLRDLRCVSPNAGSTSLPPRSG